MSEDILKINKAHKKSEKNFDDTKRKITSSKSRIERIRKGFNESRYKFSKAKINEIRRSAYQIENEKNLFVPKIKEMKKMFRIRRKSFWVKNVL